MNETSSEETQATRADRLPCSQAGSGLRLEYHDLLSLFEFLDNGDGQITSRGRRLCLCVCEL